MDRTTPSKAFGMTGMCAEPELFFIINPASHSGKGLRLWQKAEALLRSQGTVYEAFFSERRGDIARIARQLTVSLQDGGERTIVSLGGRWIRQRGAART